MAKKIAKNKKAVKKVIAQKKAVKQKNKKILKAKPIKKTSAKKKPAKPVKVTKPTKKTIKVQKKKIVPAKKKKLVSVAKPIKKIIPKKIAKSEEKIAKKEIVKIKPAKPEKPIKAEKKQSKKPTKPQKMKSVFIIKNEILNLKPTLTKLNKKEPKGKYSLEYVVNCSPSILYEFLTTPSGLCEWFADDVNIRDHKYSFIWDGGEQKADILEATPNKLLRLKWSDRNDGTYFQFLIETDDLTNDVSLIITDFSENEAEQKSSQMLWDSQVHKLLQVIGS